MLTEVLYSAVREADDKLEKIQRKEVQMIKDLDGRSCYEAEEAGSLFILLHTTQISEWSKIPGVLDAYPRFVLPLE